RLSDLGDGISANLFLILLQNGQGKPRVILLRKFDLADPAHLEAQQHHGIAHFQAEAFAEHCRDVILLFEQVLVLSHDDQDTHEDQDRNQHKPSDDLVNSSLREIMGVMHHGTSWDDVLLDTKQLQYTWLLGLAHL